MIEMRLSSRIRLLLRWSVMLLALFSMGRAETGTEQSVKLFSAAALLPADQPASFELPVDWPIVSVRLNSEVVALEAFYPSRKRVTLRARQLVPSVLTVEGEAGRSLELLLVPANGSAVVRTGPSSSSAPREVRQTESKRPRIFEDPTLGSKNIALASFDAKWSNYGMYLQRLIETVQVQWERILIESRVYPSSGTSVSVTFVLSSAGQVARISGVRATAGKQAERACTSAITSRAPYGEWTDEMKSLLGDEQELTFTFYFQ